MNMNFRLFALFAVLLVAVGCGFIAPADASVIGLIGATVSEENRASDWLKWEEDQRHSRDDALVLLGQKLVSGAVMGKSLVGAVGTATAFGGNTGNGVMGAITVTGGARQGTYKLIVIEPGANVGTFEVEDPEGNKIGRGAVAAAFAAGGLAFTLADGATDFISGDGFDIKVTGGGYKWKEYDPSLTDGAERAAGILLFAVDASATGFNADTKGVAITRQAIVGDAMLTWKAGTTAQQKADAIIQLTALQIVVRQQL